ncbi:hypothetical protein MTO96_033441 [Rhipicephalus appendiculatus]
MDVSMKSDISEEGRRRLIYLRNVLLFSILMGLIAGFSFRRILDMLGFGERGIKAGTVAAAYQASKKSKIGRFSLFAYLQRVQAKRLPILMLSSYLRLAHLRHLLRGFDAVCAPVQN